MEDFHGVVKFQSIDEHGLYTWQKVNLALHSAKGLLEMKGTGTLQQNSLVSLAAVKYAKEWSFSSALSGYGYDILWDSGKVWSFLVENENDCVKWVSQINQIVGRMRTESVDQSLIENGATSRLTDLLENHKEFLLKSVSVVEQPEKKDDQNSSLLRTMPSSDVDKVCFTTSHSTTSSKVDKLLQSTLDNFNISARKYQLTHSQCTDGQIDSSCERNDSTFSWLSEKPQHLNRIDFGGSTTTLKEDYMRQYGTEESMASSPPPGNSTRGENELNNVIQESQQLGKIALGSNSKTTHISESSMKSLDTIYTYQSLLKSLQSRCEENEIQLDKQRNSFEAEKKELSHKLISAQHELRTAQEEIAHLQRQLQDLSQKKQQHMHEELQRARSENYAFYESNIKSVELQHQREIQCLQDELIQLRKQFSQEKDQLQTVNKHQEEKLRQSSSDTEFYKQKLQLVESQLLSVQQSKSQYEQQSIQQVQELIQQYEIKQQAQHQFFQSQLLQLQNQYEEKSKEKARESAEQYSREHLREMELLRDNLENQYTKKIKMMQEDHFQTLEQSKTQHMQLHLKELESLKATFLQREKQISEDLLLLEKLHSERMQSYEQQILEKTQTIQQLQDKFAQTLLQSDIKQQTNISQYQHLEKKFSQLQLDYHETYNSKLLLQQSHDVLAQQLSALKQQAIDSITQSKILQRENQELHNSLNETRSSLLHYEKTLFPKSEDSQRQLLHEVRILQEENQMLENETTRFKSELNHFQQQCKYLETLVYGIPQHDNSTSGYSTYKSDIPGSLCSYCSSRYYPPSSPATKDVYGNQSDKKEIARPTHSVINAVKGNRRKT